MPIILTDNGGWCYGESLVTAFIWQPAAGRTSPLQRAWMDLASPQPLPPLRRQGGASNCRVYTPNTDNTTSPSLQRARNKGHTFFSLLREEDEQ